jgi:crAss001_48 related protein
MMQPYQKRVVEERTALNEKISKLDRFIAEDEVFTVLPADEKFRLRQQLSTMMRYSSILSERIEAFPKSA